MNVNMLGLLILLLASGRTALADDGAHCAASAGAKTVVAISDLHLGLGRGADGKWLAYEDFRWPHDDVCMLQRCAHKVLVDIRGHDAPRVPYCKTVPRGYRGEGGGGYSTMV